MGLKSAIGRIVARSMLFGLIPMDRQTLFGRKGGGRRSALLNKGYTALHLAFGRSVVDEPLAGRVRAAQIGAILRLTPFTILANLVNVWISVLALWSEVPPPMLLGWAAVVHGLLVVATRVWLRSLAKPIRRVSKRGLRSAVLNATILSSCWAVVPVGTFIYGSPDSIWMVSCLTTGMICAGAFVLATVPRAAIRWVVVMVIGSMIALLVRPGPMTIPILLFLLNYSLIVVASAVATAWLFVSHYLAEAELEKRGELIALLLNEFEEKASDWLWETNAEGSLHRISNRFVQVSCRSRSDLTNTRLVDLVSSENPSDAQASACQLADALSKQASFRELLVPVRVLGEERWWSLSGQPAFDENGGFAGFRGVGSDVTEARRSTELVTHMAEHDSLTGLRNRSWFLSNAAQRLAIIEDGSAFMTMMMVDLDNFKVVNDTGGHPVGDELLRKVAQRFGGICQGEAILARFGGDEFAVLGQFADRNDAVAFARRLIEVAEVPFPIAGRDFVIGATVGVAMAPEDGQTVDDLMRKADIALYKAKHGGRGQVIAFEAEMEWEVRERRELEADLREALAQNLLSLEFQPIVDARSWEVVSSEVLLRWRHPQRGDVSPAVFIPIAEEAGLIQPIGEWVLRHACAAAAETPDLNTIAVNLSPLQFMSPGLVGVVEDALETSGLSARRLVLEVTESVLIQDFAATVTILDELRDLGVKIALDDFGTGYSSLSYLRQYRFDKIKIDKSFVDEIGVRSDSLAIISAVIALAHNMGLVVTAEGVETKLQATALKSLGCDRLQGYLFGKSSPELLPRIEGVIEGVIEGGEENVGDAPRQQLG